jgi:hypothetical protein
MSKVRAHNITHSESLVTEGRVADAIRKRLKGLGGSQPRAEQPAGARAT